jgi:hypothetical protein
MTQLTNLDPNASFGDLLTTTNMGGGLSNTLQPVQDGFGNNSPMSIALNAVNFNRTIGPFQIDSVALTAPIANINSICGSPSIYPAGIYLVLPTWTTGTRPGAPQTGMIGLNTTIPQVEAYYSGVWNAL